MHNQNTGHNLACEKALRIHMCAQISKKTPVLLFYTSNYLIKVEISWLIISEDSSSSTAHYDIIHRNIANTIGNFHIGQKETLIFFSQAITLQLPPILQ